MKTKQKRQVKKVLCSFLTLAITFGASISVSAVNESDDDIVIASLQEIDNQLVYVKNKNLKFDTVNNGSPLLKAGSLPRKYDLRDYGYVTEVKSQSPYGTCWSFSTISALESNLLLNKNATSDIDLSEKHLVWFTYNGKDNNSDKSLYAGNDTFRTSSNPYLVGGSLNMSAATLLRRYGALKDSKVPYEFNTNGEAVDDSFRTQADIYLQNSEFLGEYTEYEYDSSTGKITSQGLIESSEAVACVNKIKNAIFTNGAVAGSIYSSDAMNNYKYEDTYWNKANSSYYFNGNNGVTTTDYNIQNHGITIVGWDDDYSKTNFLQTPKGNGAWIVRNSWGTNWGDNGYFYLSYYDISLANLTSFQAEDAKYNPNGETEHQYKNIYQYDGIGYGDAQTMSTYKDYKAANFFTARADETLEAVATSFIYGGVTAEYEVYTNVTSSVDPTTGTLAASGSQKFENGGFYTIKLDSPVELKKGEKYAVTIRLKKMQDNSEYTILPCELELSSRTSIGIDEGQSSLCTRGNWEELNSQSNVNGYKIGNALIKAFTNDVKEPTKPDNPEPIKYDVDGNGTVNVLDATLVQKYVAKITNLTETQKIVADANGDGNISVLDTTHIQKVVAKLLD